MEGLLYFIEAERSGEAVNHSLLKNMVRMMSALGLYEHQFQTSFLEATVIFCARESSKLIEETHVATYLQHIEYRLRLENERVDNYLESTTRKPLINVVEEQYISKHLNSIVVKGFDSLVDESRHDDLKRLYYLFGLKEVNGRDILVNACGAYIKRRGLELVMDVQKDATMIQDLLNFKEKLDRVLETAFNKDEKFVHALKNGFESFINQRQTRPVPAEVSIYFL